MKTTYCMFLVNFNGISSFCLPVLKARRKNKLWQMWPKYFKYAKHFLEWRKSRKLNLFYFVLVLCQMHGETFFIFLFWISIWFWILDFGYQFLSHFIFVVLVLCQMDGRAFCILDAVQFLTKFLLPYFWIFRCCFKFLKYYYFWGKFRIKKKLGPKNTV